jgi:hypothetical protein
MRTSSLGTANPAIPFSLANWFSVVSDVIQGHDEPGSFSDASGCGSLPYHPGNDDHGFRVATHDQLLFQYLSSQSLGLIQPVL